MFHARVVVMQAGHYTAWLSVDWVNLLSVFGKSKWGRLTYISYLARDEWRVGGSHYDTC